MSPTQRDLHVDRMVPIVDELANSSEGRRDLAAIAAVKGWNDSVMDMARKALVFGDADSVGEQIAEAMALGLDGITVDLPVNGHNLERVELLGQIAQKALD